MLRSRFIEGALAASAAAGQRARTRVRLGYAGNVCEAPTYAAPASSIFAREALAATLVRYPSEDAAIAALDAGAIDALSINLPALMRPLERGAKIRLTAGLHAGCLRVTAQNAVDEFSFGDLRGKTVATDRLHGPSMNMLWALLRKQDIDPRREVTWRAYDFVALEPALVAKQADCAAVADPFGYLLIADRVVEPYLDTADGGFSCGGDIAHGHHCFLALSARLVAEHPKIAAALTRAYVATSREIGKGGGAVAVDAVRAGYLDVDYEQAIGMLRSYLWNPSSDLVLEEIDLTARDFRRAGLLQQSTDPFALANRAYADVLHG